MMNYSNYDALVIGSGAAGFNTAIRISEGGKNVAIITENVNFGTSRNTGSDKQTYYKLGLGGDTPDSVRNMAENLFSCGAVDGDNALCEAALSARCFLNLCELGVEFPHNRYGEYIGYKTDHDPFARATSAGPLTSKFMTEALEKKASSLNIPILDGLLAIEILKDENGVLGLVCLEKETGELISLCSPNIILATGGPAGIYSDSVYPECHTGSTSLAINSGARLQNMTEWQYGLASVAPRWNVSGSYMQVLPRFVSLDENGNEYEFLSEFFADSYEALSFVFLKGYQWPFDGKKVLAGSSVIDLLVYREQVIRGRRVYLDYTKNPFALDSVDFKRLSPEAFDYLKKADICFGTPIDRLLKMNTPAYELYLKKGVNISSEKLEISLCAQHCNGGVAVDAWWQSSIPGLFAAGECAGTHGITRPGGSALNAGQVGSLRAAMYICKKSRSADIDAFEKASNEAVKHHSALCEKLISHPENAESLTKAAAKRMSSVGAAIRNPGDMKKYYAELSEQIDNFSNICGISSRNRLYLAYKLRDIFITQQAVLCAMLDYSEKVGITRGSSLIYDKNGELRRSFDKNGGVLCSLDENFRLNASGDCCPTKIQEVVIQNGAPISIWRDVRPLPDDNDFFENIWRRYREDGNVY